MDAAGCEYGPKDTYEICKGHVVGKKIGVAYCSAGALLLTPSLVTQVEDEDVEREEDEDAGDGEDGDANSSNCGDEAVVEKSIHGDGGREGRRRKGGIQVGRRVD